jgi:hypothetical protein
MSEEKGTIELTRLRGGHRDLWRAYTVLLDGVPAGKIRQGQQLQLRVPAGPHEIAMKLDRASSPPSRADVRIGQTAYFGCAPNGDAATMAAQYVNAPETFISLWASPEPVLPGAAVQPTPAARRMVRWLIMFALSCLLIVGTLIWRAATAAPVASGFLLDIGVLGAVISITCSGAITMARTDGKSSR